MNYLRLLIMALLMMLMSAVVGAQAEDVELEAFESEAFGLQALAPVGWQNVAPGVYARGEDEADLTILAIQSAPIPSDELLSALTGQLGITEFPEPESELETDLGTWAIYRVDVETPITVTVSVAVTELDGTSYVVLLQAVPDDYDSLRENVFDPVLNSVMRLTVEEDQDLPYLVEEVTFQSGDITLAGTLTLPEGEGEFPVVVLLTGSGAQDRDESLPSVTELKPFRVIADHLTRNGIAVLRFDDRGFGESEGDYETAGFSEFISDANSAIAYLVERGGFSQIGVVGHSEGATYAPEIGLSNDNVDFVVALAGATVPVIDVIQEQAQLIASADGASQEQLDAINIALSNIRTAYESADDEAIRTSIIELLTVQLETEPDEEMIDLTVAQFTSPIFQSYFDYDPAEFWLALDIPTLAIYGELDLQVSAEQNISTIEGMNDNITIVTIENMNHIFQEAETGSPSEYATLEPAIMPELLDTMTEWILELTAD